MKKNLSFFILFFSIFCFSQEEYLQKLKKRIEYNIDNKTQLQKIADLEKNKFEKTKDSLYFMSYKYALLFTFDQDKKDRISHFLTLMELWKANNNKYSIVITDVNFSLALHFENYSSNLSFYYLNQSIENELKIKNSQSLPHLYHVKGRLYYNEKKYDKAYEYFTKALKLYAPNEYLYIASMHNNFGLIYIKKNERNNAIQEFKKALEILTKKKNMTHQEHLFFLHINENLAEAYIKNGNRNESQALLENLFNQNKNREDLVRDLVIICKDLYGVYKSDQNTGKMNVIIDYLKNSEKKSPDFDTRLLISETLTDYYFNLKNYNEAKVYHFKTLQIKDEMIADNKEMMGYLNEALNKTIIKNINQKYDNEIHSQKVQRSWIILIGIIIISFLTYFFISTFKKRKIEKEMNAQQKTISDQKELILQQNLKLQEEKIRNLHLNLNIKQETAKAFLEKIKKARKSNLNNPESILKELYFDLNNLINIDKRNIDFTEQNSVENQNFIKKLSEQYPILSEQELQLCVYFRLNLSAKEISMLEKITDGSVRVYKSKIKSKMNIPKEKSIEESLQNI
ncbi:tetratricopeptide repeat protein [Chryseobacterium gambrini]|uniref:Tetratricopeptide repeat-containing protein n=1 Tax=Chryseobacterium gambrini TaxID=373672 RepID=A0A1N7NYJ5_9FLAO|nr:tetratricopeptide repeat protein [Chryseobacterium gambrini]SIT03400.1 Tetratricopeptide repeat-containing protein [Chryseobacterium gambrini]